MFLMDNNWFETVSLDIEHATQITKILDAGKELCFSFASFKCLKNVKCLSKLSIGNEELCQLHMSFS